MQATFFAYTLFIYMYTNEIILISVSIHCLVLRLLPELCNVQFKFLNGDVRNVSSVIHFV